MSKNQIIARLEGDTPVVSVEFFPPKTEAGAEQILEAARALQGRDIAFASITCGAGGSTRGLTLEYGRLLREEFHFHVVPHVTCAGYSRRELEEMLDYLIEAKFPGFMALRGDPPKDSGGIFKHPPNGLAHASDLVALARERCRLRGVSAEDFSIGVAGYPGKHPESSDAAADMHWLAHKVAQGSDFITTQLFFDNAVYFDFVVRCREIGIKVPVLPGILPLPSIAQAHKFSAFSGVTIPVALMEKLESCGSDSEAAEKIGLEWAFSQISELLACGAPGFHLYILNRAKPALSLLSRLANR
ncbi:MAG: methylenetetrahydrofolate reductase [Puniceicoccales bacterium]|jgi:methylenetetrahydrofolate reductase (NADPH)|nr:methylenetetrahydrofolate reductase [Puniceicoccales bacterium]